MNNNNFENIGIEGMPWWFPRAVKLLNISMKATWIRRVAHHSPRDSACSCVSFLCSWFPSRHAPSHPLTSISFNLLSHSFTCVPFSSAQSLAFPHSVYSSSSHLFSSPSSPPCLSISFLLSFCCCVHLVFSYASILPFLLLLYYFCSSFL